MKSVRCAIYTRKSSEEGLQQEFNSLQAQRESCAAYIVSQKHEGWTLLPTLYDDGGFSGGNMERPALKTLLADVESGKIDIIVVYKVDRLTRSLTDFARLVEMMDKKGISFVSITQQFNTTTSLGRLTLNVLLSFAQFEREVTGERIRDKIALSKQKGKWMGGTVPIGYNAMEQKLVPNGAEAKTVKHIYKQYLALQSVNLLKAELDAEGYTTKQRFLKNGKATGGLPFFKGHLYRILQNRVYLGEVTHKGKHYKGEHEAIIDEDSFNKVQTTIASNRMKNLGSIGAKHPCLLAGKLFDDKGNTMTPKHSNTRKRHYRYYTSQAIIQGRPHDAGSLRNIPAHEIEQLVRAELYNFLKDTHRLQPYLTTETLDQQNQYLQLAANLQWQNHEQERLFIRSIISSVQISNHSITITLCAKGLLLSLISLQQGIHLLQDTPLKTESPIILTRTITLAQTNSGTKVVLGSLPSQINLQLVKAVTRSFLWHGQLISGEVQSMQQLQKREEMASDRYLAKIMKLRFLSPRIITSILEGTQPVDWTVEKLFAVNTLDWHEQHQLLGCNYPD